MLKMTFVFFSGIAIILIPIGLGAAGLAQIFRDFHKELYIFGGLFMVILALLAVFGKGLSIPMPKKLKIKSGETNSKSVFFLGMLSGAATSCCAPVLAGAMTLAVISGAFWKAVIVTFAYVFGMTFPLFITAYLYDRFKLESSRFVKGKLLEIKFGAKTFFVHSTNIFAGAVFLVMGAVLLALAFSGNAFFAPSFQVEFGKALNTWSQSALDVLFIIPEFIWAIIIIGIFSFFIYKVRKHSEK